MIYGKQLEMAHLSPTVVAINTIAHCLANALDASAGLDAAMSDDLRALLRVATGELERVRKANRKASSAAKRAPVNAEKKSSNRSSGARLGQPFAGLGDHDVETAKPSAKEPKPAKPKAKNRKTAVTASLSH